MSEALPSTEQAAEHLRELGWRTGDVGAVNEIGGATWLVYCQRGEDRIEARASTQRDAWIEALRQAQSLE